MKLKAHQIIEISNNIGNYFQELNNLKGPVFLHTILENIKLLNNEIEKINNLIKGTDEYNEYQNKRIDICNNYAEKDEDGNVVKVVNNNIEEFKIDKDNKEFVEEIEILQKKYKNAIDEFLKQIDEYNNYLETTIEINFSTLSINDIPEDINFELMKVINIFIEK